MSIVRIDLSKLTGALAGALPHKADTQRVLQGIGAAAVQKWKRLAQTELTSSSRDYAAGIQVFYEGNSAFVELVGTLPNLIENGFPGGDMRDWMLKSPKAKRGKNGRYLVIPFRHGTPGTGGRNVGTAMPAAIHDVAKVLGATLSRPGVGGRDGKTAWGERLHAGLSMGKTARKILLRKEKSWHASSIYTGMVRKEKTYERATQSSYQTFRTISERVIRGEKDEQGKATQHWYHPGVAARRFAPKVQKHVEKLAMGILTQALRGR